MDSTDQLVRMMGLNAPETMPEAAFDHEGVRGVDLISGQELTPGDDGLAAGIAAVFDSIRNGDGFEVSDGDDALPEDNGATFALLSELNRLWDRPPA